MQKKIRLNSERFQFSLSHLPCLIHGAHKAGSSLFTVSMLADLYVQGNKILFLSGYHMARDEFLAQTNADDVILLEQESDLDIAKDKQVAFVKKENSNWFIRLANELPDISERVILIKNFDLFEKEVFDHVKARENIILSGDLDMCEYSDAILQNTYATTILFSQPTKAIDITMPLIEKYHGFIKSKVIEGEIELQF